MNEDAGAVIAAPFEAAMHEPGGYWVDLLCRTCRRRFTRARPLVEAAFAWGANAYCSHACRRRETEPGHPILAPGEEWKLRPDRIQPKPGSRAWKSIQAVKGALERSRPFDELEAALTGGKP